MRVRAHLSVVSDEATIRSIQRDANLSEATIRRLKTSRPGSEDEYWWHWETGATQVDPANLDEGLKDLLHNYRPIFGAIKKYGEDVADVYLQMVTEYQAAEEPEGMYLSRETISLLNELGAAFDNDVYVRD